LDSMPEQMCPIPQSPGETVYPRDVVTASDGLSAWMEMAEHLGCQLD
jgi:hypothetical protein